MSKRLKTGLVGLLLVAALAGCGRNEPPPAPPAAAASQSMQAPKPLTKVSVRLPWIRAYGEAGTEVAAELGYFKDVGLDVSINPGSVENSPIRKVLTGEDQFGIVEPAQVITAISKERAPLVILAVKAQRSPMCMMSRTSANVKTVKDFEGKRVGYNPLFDTGYLAMLKEHNVNRSRIKEVRAAFSLDPFLQGQTDVWPVYISNEPIVARSKGVDVSLICADDAGVKLYEHAVFARKDYVEKNPAVVEAFLKGFVRGWLTALKDTDKAIEISAKRVKEMDVEQEKKNLAAFAPVLTADRAKTDGFAWVDPGMMEGLAKTLKSLGLIDEVPPGASMVDNSFLLKIDRKL